nr:peroxidase 16-like [Ipomoea trifida]
MEHQRKNSMVVASGMLVCLVLLVSSAHAQAQLRTDFYKNTCPNVESLVRSAVQQKFRQTFGCDASVLLASPNGKAEKDHPDNLSLAGDGFDTVIKAKAAVDSNPQCRNKVSCADILALATRDVVSLLKFEKLNYHNACMVAGAHTIGFSHCKHVAKRIYRFQPRSWIDPTLNLRYAFQLRQMCPLKVDPRIAINMDPTTPNTFDNAYFKNLQQGKGLFVSDQVLFTDRRSRNTVNFFASNNAAFHQAFAAAITKLGRIGVLTGNLGEIRRDCTRPN